jgi:hypothetical protein
MGRVGYHNNGKESRKAALTMIKRYVDEALQMAQDIGPIEGVMLSFDGIGGRGGRAFGVKWRITIAKQQQH